MNNYGDYSTRSFVLSQNYTVPSGAYAIVDMVQLFVIGGPGVEGEITKEYYGPGETITFISTEERKVVVFENDT